MPFNHEVYEEYMRQLNVSNKMGKLHRTQLQTHKEFVDSIESTRLGIRVLGIMIEKCTSIDKGEVRSPNGRFNINVSTQEGSKDDFKKLLQTLIEKKDNAKKDEDLNKQITYIKEALKNTDSKKIKVLYGFKPIKGDRIFTYFETVKWVSREEIDKLLHTYKEQRKEMFKSLHYKLKNCQKIANNTVKIEKSYQEQKVLTSNAYNKHWEINYPTINYVCKKLKSACTDVKKFFNTSVTKVKNYALNTYNNYANLSTVGLIAGKISLSIFLRAVLTNDITATKALLFSNLFRISSYVAIGSTAINAAKYVIKTMQLSRTNVNSEIGSKATFMNKESVDNEKNQQANDDKNYKNMQLIPFNYKVSMSKVLKKDQYVDASVNKRMQMCVDKKQVGNMNLVPNSMHLVSINQETTRRMKKLCTSLLIKNSIGLRIPSLWLSRSARANEDVGNENRVIIYDASRKNRSSKKLFQLEEARGRKKMKKTIKHKVVSKSKIWFSKLHFVTLATIAFIASLTKNFVNNTKAYSRPSDIKVNKYSSLITCPVNSSISSKYTKMIRASDQLNDVSSIFSKKFYPISDSKTLHKVFNKYNGINTLDKMTP